MARRFDGVDDTLTVDSSPVTGFPLTMACWFRPERFTAAESLLVLGDKDSDNHYHHIRYAGDVAGDPITYRVRDGGTVRAATTTTGVSTSVWAHACARATSSTDRAAFINGGSKATSAIAVTPTGLDRVSIGAYSLLSSLSQFRGRIADAVVWDVALTDAEIAALGVGANPLFIRPGSIQFYAPLWGTSSPERDYTRGQRHLTITGAVVEPHAPVAPMAGLGWVPARTVSDVTPPTPNITAGPSKTKISRVAGQDITTLTFVSDEDYQSYQIRVVPATTSPVTAGTLLESGTGGTAGVGRDVDVTDDELVDAGGVEGNQIIKVFVRDNAGNWSS